MYTDFILKQHYAKVIIVTDSFTRWPTVITRMMMLLSLQDILFLFFFCYFPAKRVINSNNVVFI